MPGKKGKRAGKSQSRSVKAGVNFPVGRLQRYIKQGLYAKRVSGSGVYMAAVLEYIVAEILECASDMGSWLFLVKCEDGKAVPRSCAIYIGHFGVIVPLGSL